MSGDRERPDKFDQWCATVDALDALLQGGAECPEVDPAAIAEVRRLITLRIAGLRRDSLPTFWVRRDGRTLRLIAAAGTAADAQEEPESADHPAADHPVPPRPPLPR